MGGALSRLTQAGILVFCVVSTILVVCKNRLRSQNEFIAFASSTTGKAMGVTLLEVCS